MTTRTGQRGRWRSGAVVLVFLALSGLWFGCSPKKHYKLLSFFFDGVPNPDDPQSSAAGPGGRGRPALLSVMHAPYQQNKCDACHTSRNAFEIISTPGEDKCFACHEKVKDQHAFLHGPVAANRCLWCHDPHRSNVPSLLRVAAGRLCRECHTQELLDPSVPEHLDEKKDCLQCHAGHGGSDRYFLKPGARAPATQPAPGGGAP